MKTIDAISDHLILHAEMLVMDFDGVLTDNRVYVDRTGTETVGCWRSDGLGLENMRALGMKLLIISTEADGVVGARAKKLRIPCLSNVSDKGDVLRDVSLTNGVGLNKIVFVGNDINDLPALEIAGVPVVVADSHPDVRRDNFFTTMKPGGFGAIRELCDLISRVRTNNN